VDVIIQRSYKNTVLDVITYDSTQQIRVNPGTNKITKSGG